ncbi:hypothetical protein BX667DRAFT_197889 [Coemansia mojavensis]|nr:hypothetical protein BX667DRAFT_197889 [Coemansia mojavensis]
MEVNCLLHQMTHASKSNYFGTQQMCRIEHQQSVPAHVGSNYSQCPTSLLDSMNKQGRIWSRENKELLFIVVGECAKPTPCILIHMNGINKEPCFPLSLVLIYTVNASIFFLAQIKFFVLNEA